MASPRSPRTDGASPLVSQEDTPDTPSSTAPPSTPLSAPATLQGSLSAVDASKLSSRRGKITQIACVACRQRKSKCDGARPVCHACQSRPNSKCVYDVTLDQRKPSSLRQRVGELEQEVGNFRDILGLLLNALPERLKPRFEGFVQHLDDEGGLSSDLLDDARSRLAKSETPDKEDMMEDEEVAQQTQDSNMGGMLEPGPRPAPGSSQIPRQDNNPYFFDYGPATPGSAGNIFGNHSDIGLALPDGGGTGGTTYWRLQSFSRPNLTATPGEQADHNQMGQQQLPAQQNQTFNWQMTAGNSMRTVHLYGRLNNGDPLSASTVDLNMNVPIHLVHPLNEDDTKPLGGMYSGVYVGFRDSKRQLVRNGANMSDVLGPMDLDFRAAINPSSFHNNLPLFTWASELFGAHRNLRPSDRVACAWMVTTLMRWQIYPTRENFERIPPWLRPTPSQCFIPHAANLDYLPWPQIRDALISTKQDQAEVTVNALSVNWPYSDGEVLLVNQSLNRLSLNPAFEAHIASLTNWSLAGSLLSSLPFLNGLAKTDSER